MSTSEVNWVSGMVTCQKSVQNDMKNRAARGASLSKSLRVVEMPLAPIPPWATLVLLIKLNIDDHSCFSLPTSFSIFRKHQHRWAWAVDYTNSSAKREKLERSSRSNWPKKKHWELFFITKTLQQRQRPTQSPDIALATNTCNDALKSFQPETQKKKKEKQKPHDSDAIARPQIVC